MLVTAGRPYLARLLAGDRQLRLGLAVGSGTTAETDGDCHLEGDGDALSAWHAALDHGFPHDPGDGRLVLQATFGHEMALFHWREVGVFAVDGDIAPGHALAGTGNAPLLLTRRALAHPVHPDPKLAGSGIWVLRTHLSFA